MRTEEDEMQKRKIGFFNQNQPAHFYWHLKYTINKNFNSSAIVVLPLYFSHLLKTFLSKCARKSSLFFLGPSIVDYLTHFKSTSKIPVIEAFVVVDEEPFITFL